MTLGIVMKGTDGVVLVRAFTPEISGIAVPDLLRVVRVVLVLEKAAVLIPPSPSVRLRVASRESLMIVVIALSSFYVHFVII